MKALLSLIHNRFIHIREAIASDVFVKGTQAMG